MANDKELLEQLSGVPLFAKVSEKHLKAIAQQMKRRQFGPGETVLVSDDRPAQHGRMYIILEGEAEARKGETALATLGVGDHFGEMALLDGGPRSAEVVAKTDLSTVSLASWNFKPLLMEEPEIAVSIIESLVSRLRASDEAR